MREPKVRVGARAGVAEGSVGERVSGEREKPFGTCQLPTLTGVSNHHSLFGLLGFRSISDPVLASAINTLALEPSSVPSDPSSLDAEPSSVLPDSSSFDPEPSSSSVRVSASAKYVTLYPASVSVSKTSSASQLASGAPAAIKLDPVATKGADFAPLSKADPSAALNSAETSAFASATKLVSDVFIHGSAIPVPGSSNQTAAEDFRSDVSASAGQDLSVQTAAEDFRSDISASPAQDLSVQTAAEDFRSDISASPAQDLSVQNSGSDISAIPAQDSSVQTTPEDARSDINDWSAGWRAEVGPMWGVFCCGMCGSTQSPGGLDGGQPVLNNTVDLGLLSDAGSSTASLQSADALSNPIVLENMLQGSPQSEWGIDGAGSDNIEGFATDISVDNGQTVSFKINTDSDHYRIDIYRIGYYGGDGARKVATFDQTLPTAQDQPIPLFDPATKLLDAGNWSVSATWDVPDDAVSGIYFAKLTRLDGVEGENIIPFIVRDDENASDITFQTSDTTWQAYNPWGGYNLYGSIDGGLIEGRAYAVSYNRPISTRGGGIAAGPQDFIYSVEYPAIRWLEQNGYNINYISGVDTARDGEQLLNSNIFLSVGHDEYWSGDQYDNVMAARDAGVNLAFWSGNEVYWRTRWETSIDGSDTPYRTLVTYKEIRSGANTDPNDTTSTWRDPVYGPGLPENSLTGTMFTVNSYRLDTMTIPYALSNFRFWSNTEVADLRPGEVYSLTPNLLGYEWDSDLDNGFRPAGLINLSSTTLQVEQKLLDYGTTTGDGTATHALTLYRAESGALVFGAGTVYWAWGLDDNHDLEETPVDPDVQQAMVNLFADMGVQPDTLMASLVLASQSTDHTAPTSTITTPGAAATLPAFSPITITGTAVDTGGGIVAVVEVSTDNGTTWHRANGFENWTYSWTPIKGGTYTIKSRAVDDSVNVETTAAGVAVTVDQPLTRTLFTGNEIPAVQTDVDPNGVNLGVKFVATQAGSIVGMKFYKGLLDTGDHVGSLWSSTGTLLASATFTNESVGGWQTVIFSNPVTVTGGTTYVISYHSNGHYADTAGFFADAYGNGPLSVAGNASGTGNSYFAYGNASAFPSNSAGGTNYWVDVLYLPTGGGVNHAPSLNDDAAFTQRNTTLNIAGSQLLANDSDADGDVLSISDVGGAVGGTVSYNAQTNTVTFIPTTDSQGPASFEYFATDGQEAETGTVNVAVVAPFTAEGLFASSQTPAVLSDPDPAQVNLGVKFVASQAGSIAGLEYYRGSGDTGTHTGSLWSNTGQLLATATFAAETASGWQSVNFSSPVTIAPNTTYVASYHSNGHYAATGDYFSALYDPNGSLATSGPAAGVYTYGAGNLFPTTTTNANYWVDVLFVSSGAPIAVNDSGFTTSQDNALAIPAATLLANDMDPNSPFSFVRVVPGVGVGGNATYNAQTDMVTFAPNDGFIGAATFTYQITDGTNDPASASVNLTVLPPASTEQLFAYSDTPAILSDPDPNSISLGVKFLATEGGEITGLKYYKGAQDTGIHVGSLWTSDGITELASATFTNESASGWQYVTFDNPVAISAGTTYVASYHSNGHYTATSNYFTSAHTNGSLATPAAAGVYTYGAGNPFPTTTSTANYWVDVLFAPSGAPVAVNDNGFTTTKATALTIEATDLLLNDTDPNTSHNELSVVAVASQLGGSVSLASNGVTFTPTPGYIGAASFTYQISDDSHTSDPATVELTVLPASTTAQLFAYTHTPANLSDPDPAPVNLGVKFDSSLSGVVTGLKYYKGVGDTGTHVGSLWASDGTLLARATFTNETASGWQYVTFADPVAVTAGTTYVASYSSNGHYASNGNGPNSFTTEYTNGILSTSGPNAGVYTYGTGPLFPATASAANYWVDVLLDPAAGANEAPSIMSNGGGPTAAVSIAENTSAVTIVTATDPDVGQTLSYSIVGGVDQEKFTIDASTGVLSFVTAPDFEVPTDAGPNNVYDVTVQVSDGAATDTQALAVSVTNLNDVVPTITSNGGGTSGPATVSENSTAVTTVTATDPDGTLTYSIVGGVDQAKFTINESTGILSFVTAPDFEVPTDVGTNNVYDVIVQVSDGAATDTQALAVSVTNLNDVVPTITSNGGGTSGPATVSENSTAATTVTATDPDGTLTYSIVGGVDQEKFTINESTGVLSFVTAPDFEVPTDVGTNNVYDVTVQVSDGNGFDAQAIAVTVQNVTGASINGTAQAETLTGTNEEDIINGLGGNDTLTGLGGNDTFNYAFGNGADIVNGGADIDTLSITGTAAANTLDVVFNGAALTGFEGGTITGVESVTANLLGGTDALSYVGTTADVTVDLVAGAASGFTAIASIENVTGGTGNDTMTGGAGPNVLSGGAGGNDWFIATVNDGNDTYSGGTGTDIYDLSRIALAGAIITTTSATGADIGSDTLSSIENIIGSQANDTITLAAGVNIIDGQAGDDTITAGAGNDIVSGGAGNDAFNYTMGDGADTVNGGIGSDTLNVVGTAAADTLDVIFDGTAITNFEGGTVTGVKSFTANLGAGTDTLTFAGTTAAITVDLTAGTASGFTSLVGVENAVGGSGSDTLIDLAGVNNTLTGGAGNDTFVVHDAGDVVSEASGVAGGVDIVQSFVTYTISDIDVENLTLLGTDNINGTGNAAANMITGNAGNNVLTGGAGIDTLIGGLGDDTFDFNALNNSVVGAGNNDLITDFNGAGAVGGDVIDVFGIDANSGVLGNQAFAFINTAAFSAAGQLRYVQVNGDTLIQANTNANTGTIEFELKLTGLHTLSVGDFIL